MKKGPGEKPRMLPYVLQAVTDLKDVNGSTIRKILDQVHTAINITNVKPKPRNVVMQLKRALKYGVDTGVLRHKAGKYRLTLDKKSIKKNNAALKVRETKTTSRKRRRRPRKTQKPKKNRRRVKNTALYRRSTSPSEASVCSMCARSLATDSYENKTSNKRRRRRSITKRAVQFMRGGKKTKNKGRMRRVRQATPMPTQSRSRRRPPSPLVQQQLMDVKADEDNESPEIINEMEKLENVFAKDCVNQDGDADPSIDNEMPNNVDTPPECDNPECLCNLKQEPSEDGNDADFYQ